MDKRFLLFGFDGYYPSGGFNDLIDSYDTIDQVIIELNSEKPGGEYKCCYYQCYDRVEGRQIPVDALVEQNKNGG